MVTANSLKKGADRKLALQEVLGWLVADGLISADKTALLRGLAERGAYQDQHPLSDRKSVV